MLANGSCRASLMVGAAAVALALAAPAAAQTAPTTQELLDQIKLLQKRIEQLEASQKRAATRPAPASRAAAGAPAKAGAAPGAVVPSDAPADGPPPSPPSPAPSGPPSGLAGNPEKPNGSFMLGAAKLTLGGYVDLTGYYRSRNENRGTGTGYSSIPFYGPTPQGNSGEIGLSAQQTRLTGKIEAPVGEASQLMAYVEMDFNNGAGGANSVQSNSYTPRLRQAFGTYEGSSWYLLGGQAWSLATPFKKGLGALGTWQPPTIDTNYMVGYSYARVPMVRAVKAFDGLSFGSVALGVEANTPQTVFGGTASLPAGQSAFTQYPGNSGLNPQASYSVNVAPDLIAKVALDTGFGHVDAFGVARWFRSQVAFGNQSVNYDTFGGGFGVSAFIPVGKWADVMGNFMYGSGIGRYGAGGLPDVTFQQDGSLAALPQGMGTVGVVGHVLPKVLDLYGFYGWNWIGASYFPGGGYGNPTFDNRGCFNPNAANSGGQGCAGNNQTLGEWTVGLNWTMLSGRYGTVRSGLQYSNVARQAYGGFGGAPGAVENLFMVNLRYIPFD